MKQWRTRENRRLRHNAKQIINICENYDNLIIPVLNDYDTLWGSPQDGRKRYIPKPALNQCELDLQRYLISSFRWYGTISEERLDKLVNSFRHGGRDCECYSNKRHCSYWKIKRK
jgi:hypothetical protein